MDGQEKVETPTGGVSGDVWTYASVETFPALVCMYAAQSVPYLLSEAALGFGCRYLKLDFEEVERVHAEDGDDACAESCYGMVLRESEEEDGSRERATYQSRGREETGRVLV